MKNNAIKYVWFTTFYLLIFTVLCQLNTGYPALMSMLIIGQFMVLFMVYKVLTDHYKTDKTFRDWYEDKPMQTLDDKEEKTRSISSGLQFYFCLK